MLNDGNQTPVTEQLSHHLPVMVDKVIEHLLYIKTTGKNKVTRFIDGTVGGGGHAAALLEYLDADDELYCFDRDPEALQRAKYKIGEDKRVRFFQSSYSEAGSYLTAESVGGVLLDLGLSSDQLAGNRGFAFSRESDLDMRFDPGSDTSAYDLVNRYSIDKMREIFFAYGEEPLSPRIARKIGEERLKGAICTTSQLSDIIQSAVPVRFRTKAIARIFQAIRIEVNREIDLLEEGLKVCWDLLEVGGVLCVISYHSIEDRRMKRFIAGKAKGCICPPKLPVCACGKSPEAKILTSSALRPTNVEMRTNSRARSARLRAAVKI